MYIAPNSTIRILQNIRLTSEYIHTLYFSSASAQSTFFISQAKYTLNNYTYLRKERRIRVEILADNLYDCNYLMFRNTNYGDKWFYAFIKNVEYINNETSEIEYEIDVMQTWAFDYYLNPSFVEREHTITDNVGDNLVPDDLELGEYISDDFSGTGHMGNYRIVIASTFDENMDDVAGGYYSNIYSGLCYNVFTSASEANTFIEDATAQNKQNGIVSVFMMPVDFVGDLGEVPKSYTLNIDKKVTGAIDGYTPKNNKLYTYPYNFLYITNLNGVSAELPYEYFSTENCTFGLTGDMSCNPQIVLCPYNYKGVSANYNEKMILDGFPQCSYNIDSFKAWLAQTGASQLVTTIGAGATMAGGLAKAGGALALGGATIAGVPLVAVAGAIAIGGILAQTVQHATLPPQAQGGQGNSAMTAMRIKDFAFMHMHIRGEFAEIIDNYWTMFGYPIHTVKTPNISSRPHWNYTKCQSVNLNGNIPGDDLNKIRSIYNNGITFWKNNNEIGNYNLDNSPA